MPLRPLYFQPNHNFYKAFCTAIRWSWRTHRALVLKGAETLATSGIEGYVALNVGGKDNAAPRLAEDRLAAQRL